MSEGRVILKSGREESLLRHHPWVFSGAVARTDGLPADEAASGCTVRIVSHDGRALGVAAWSPESQIRVRVWSFAADTAIDPAFFRARLRRAIAYRAALLASGVTDAVRLVGAEADGLPGVIVDRYADTLVCQFLSAGAERWRDVLLDLLAESLPGCTIHERSDGEARTREGLAPRCSVAPDTPLVEMHEHGIRYLVDIMSGHKTGFYLDQRDNRAIVRDCARGRSVLNCFSYTGGFGLAALAGAAAEVTNVDSSADALALAHRNAALNGMDDARFVTMEGDVFHLLRRFRDEGRSFDLIVLDPPKFAASASQVERAARGYKDINLLAFKLLRPDGLLSTFSCSGHMTAPLFQKIVADAALDAGREAVIERHLQQAADHPVALAVPESLYLKGLLCRVAVE
jgi:23S rRNA (cytosine1962-C5)-methyltransferase